jgi:hypothetical protein
VYELQRELGLKKVPRSLVCFDISHAQGTDTVASCVWFENARAKRAEYRKFKVETVQGIDDFASMREVVGRYFRRRLDEERPLPDLVVIDGGKGQLNAAHEALEALGLGAHPLISLAKREEEVFVFGRAESVRISRRSPGLRMLQQARDEAHRFAVTFQRKRRAVRTVTSALMSVPGIGPVKRPPAAPALRSVQALRDAGPEAVAALPGWTAAGARKVLDALAASDPTREAPDAPAPAGTRRRPLGAGCRRSSSPDPPRRDRLDAPLLRPVTTPPTGGGPAGCALRAASRSSRVPAGGASRAARALGPLALRRRAPARARGATVTLGRGSRPSSTRPRWPPGRRRAAVGQRRGPKPDRQLQGAWDERGPDARPRPGRAGRCVATAGNAGAARRRVRRRRGSAGPRVRAPDDPPVILSTVRALGVTCTWWTGTSATPGARARAFAAERGWTD